MKYKNRTLKELKKKTSWVLPEERKLIEKAFELTKKQKRSTAQHELNTAFILAELKLDIQSIIAGMLHEALYEKDIKEDEIRKTAGEEILEIVKESAILKEIKKQNADRMKPSELSKIILGVSKDIRSLFVEIASQLDKIRFEVKKKRPERKKLARLILEIYAPVSHKLGLYEIEWELNDLAFKILNPKNYYEIKRKVKEKRITREKKVERIVKEIKKILKKEKINAQVYGRAKSFYGIYKKMLRGKKFEEILDLLGIRVLCNSITDCYRILGLIYANYEPFGKFEDYIANPKPNNYRSIHAVFFWKKQPVEVQIRTFEMHRNAEEGLAAHWKYKELEKNAHFDKQLSWAKQLVEWQRTLKGKRNLMKSLKAELEQKNIFVLTPKKEVIVLPENATPVDFAFAIHSDVGEKCSKAIVDGRLVPLNFKLKNANTVSIITSNKRTAKRQWLNFVKTGKARDKIKKLFGIKSTQEKKKKRKTDGRIISTDSKKAVIAKCCNPIAGDEIVGFKTTKRKISIHRKNCPFLKKLDNKRKVKVEWAKEKAKKYSTKIRIKSIERAGLLMDLLKELEKSKIAVNRTEAKSTSKNITECVFELNVKDLNKLEALLKRMRRIPSVFEAERA